MSCLTPEKGRKEIDLKNISQREPSYASSNTDDVESVFCHGDLQLFEVERNRQNQESWMACLKAFGSDVVR